MKKVLNRNLLFSVVFVLSFLFVITLVRGQTPQEIIFDPIIKLFTDWSAGNLGVNIAKYLFFVLVAIFTWSLLDFADIIPSQLVTWIASIVMAFLSVAYIAPEQIWVLLTSYNAYGLTLLFFAPLIALGLFTLRIAARGSAQGILAQWIVWIVYGMFIAGSFVWGIFKGQIKVNDPFAWIYIAAISIVILVILFNTQIVRWLSNKLREQEEEVAENVTRKAIRYDKLRAGALDELAGSRRSRKFSLN